MPVPVPESAVPVDIESVGVVTLDEEPAGVVGVAPWSSDFEQPARETESASASAPVRSLFMEGPCDPGWSVSSAILPRQPSDGSPASAAVPPHQSAQNDPTHAYDRR